MPDEHLYWSEVAPMDMWAWILERTDQLREEGHHRLADIVDDLPTLVLDDKYEQVDSIVPEGVALARALGDKWLEVFIRHWNLQCLVLDRMEVKQALPETIDLLHFSHQEATKDCPQSVCVVQDITKCYSRIDGPGYAEECLAAAQEAWQKIDPSWSCFPCIGYQYADAFYDMGDYQAALDFLDEADNQLLKAGHGRNTGNLLFSRIDSLIALQKYDEALRAAQRLHKPNGGLSFEIGKKLTLAEVYAKMGDFDNALKNCPLYASIKGDLGSRGDWFEVNFTVAMSSPEHNTVDLAIKANQLLQEYIPKGINRIALDRCVQSIELAIQRNRKITAKLLLQTCKKVTPRLRKNLGADQIIEELERKIEKLKTPEPPNDLQTLLDSLDGKNIEYDLEQLHVASEQWPENEGLAIEYARALESFFLIRHGKAHLRKFLQAHPDAEQVILEYGRYLKKHFPNKFLPFLESHKNRVHENSSKINLDWLKARDYYDKKHLIEARELLFKILEEDNDLFNVRLLLANVERDLENYQQAMFHLNLLMRQDPDDNLLWDMIVNSTLAGNWQIVRQMAAKLNMEIDGEGEIDGNYGWCRIQIEDGTEKRIYLAIRTGPVTARIESIAKITDTQHFGDTVVFDPLPLNELNRENKDGITVDEEGYDTYIYPCIKIVNNANYQIFDLDGIHPGKEKIEELSSGIKKLGVIFSPRSTDEYVVYDYDDDKDLPGFYAYILVKPDFDLHLLNDYLVQYTKKLPRPFLWTSLLETLGEDALLKKQMEYKERYDFE